MSSQNDNCPHITPTVLTQEQLSAHNDACRRHTMTSVLTRSNSLQDYCIHTDNCENAMTTGLIQWRPFSKNDDSPQTVSTVLTVSTVIPHRLSSRKDSCSHRMTTHLTQYNWHNAMTAAIIQWPLLSRNGNVPHTIITVLTQWQSNPHYVMTADLSWSSCSDRSPEWQLSPHNDNCYHTMTTVTM